MGRQAVHTTVKLSCSLRRRLEYGITIAHACPVRVSKPSLSTDHHIHPVSTQARYDRPIRAALMSSGLPYTVAWTSCAGSAQHTRRRCAATTVYHSQRDETSKLRHARSLQINVPPSRPLGIITWLPWRTIHGSAIPRSTTVLPGDPRGTRSSAAGENPGHSTTNAAATRPLFDAQFGNGNIRKCRRLVHWAGSIDRSPVKAFRMHGRAPFSPAEIGTP